MKQFKIWLKEKTPLIMPLHTEDRQEITLEDAMEITWRECCQWFKSLIAERLKNASCDDNVACVKNIENDVRQELSECLKVEDNDGRGFRLICQDCDTAQLKECQKESFKQIHKDLRLLL